MRAEAGVAVLVVLGACSGPDPAALCTDFAPDPWDPVIEPDVRVDETIAVWEPVGEATVDPTAAANCAAPPCVAVTGPGGASTTMLLNRGVAHTVSGTIHTDTPVTLTVYHVGSAGILRALVEAPFDADTTTPFELPFSLQAAGEDVIVTLTLESAGTATLDDFALVGERWAASGDGPQASTRVGFLVHVEDDPNFLVEEARWRLRARVLEGLSATLGAHGARLTIQADATFVRGMATWDPDWLAAREAEGAGWSVHIHDETATTGVEQAVRDGRTALREAGVSTSDLNGGFGEAPWLQARLAGITSLSAFKDPATQLGLPHVQVQPWRIADGVGSDDPEAFLLHEPEGPVLYLPGHDVREVEHARFPLVATQTLSQVLAHARVDHVNTWYWVLHVDGFGPSTDDEPALEAYLADAFADDLAAYDRFLTETTDPLAADGWVTYDTAVGMATAWRDWFAPCDGEAVE